MSQLRAFYWGGLEGGRGSFHDRTGGHMDNKTINLEVVEPTDITTHALKAWCY